MSSLQALASSRMISSLASRTKFKLNNLGRRNNLSLWWVKAHIGIEGNEIADSLAKQGTQLAGPTRFPLPYKLNAAYKTLQRHYEVKWDKRWKHPSCRQTKTWFGKRQLEKSANLLKLGRITLGEVVKFITGFNFLAYHQFNIGSLDSDNCCLCDTGREAALHLTSTCPAVTSARLSAFGPWGVTPQWSVNALLSFIKEPKISELLTDPDLITLPNVDLLP